MFRFILKRVFNAIPLLIGITLLSFFMVQLAPGDPFTELSQNPKIDQKLLDELNAHFGFDQAIHVQYFKWVYGMIRLDFGQSTQSFIPVTSLMMPRLWNTLKLALITMLLTWCIAIPVGVYCARYQYSLGDQLFSIVSFVGMSLPTFFIAFLFIYWTIDVGWIPIGGTGPTEIGTIRPLWQKTWDTFRYLLIPVSVMVISSVGSLLRLMRGNMLDVLHAPYITTARAKGLSEIRILGKHALRNAINPMITIFGYQLSGLLSGVALTEIILSWPGLGSLMLEAVLKQDYYLIMGSLVISSWMLILSNMLADILLAYADPRIRYQ